MTSSRAQRVERMHAIVVSGSTVYLGSDFATIGGKNHKRLGSVPQQAP